MADSTSRERLKKKVLDRWENEGGRLCDNEIKATESKTRSPSEDQATNMTTFRSKTPKPFHGE